MRHLLHVGVLALCVCTYCACFGDASALGKVRDTVVLSDRWSGTFFEVHRDGRVELYHEQLTVGADSSWRESLFKVADVSADWHWRAGYLPLLTVKPDVELFACGDSLYVHDHAKYVRWPGAQPIDKAIYDQAAAEVITYWEGWFSRGAQLPSLGPKRDNAWKSSLVQGLCMLSGRHTLYGAGGYRCGIHDAFPPTIIAVCEVLIQFKHPEEAAEELLAYLNRFLLSDGSIDYYGPSISEYGCLLWLGEKVMRACPNREVLFMEKMPLLVKRVLRMFQYWTKGSGALGPKYHLLSGVPEADTRDNLQEYFHNNLHVLLGLRAMVSRLKANGLRSLSWEVSRYAEMLDHNLQKGYALKKRELGGIPYSMQQKELARDIQSSRESTYANYRYYPEMLECGWMPKADAEAYMQYRQAHNGYFHGMTRITLESDRVDNWPLCSLARGCLEYGMTNRFDALLESHLENYLSDDTYTAYEQVENVGSPRRKAAPACVVVQLVYPRMLAWKLLGYESWAKFLSSPALPTVEGFYASRGGKDDTVFSLTRHNEQLTFSFRVLDDTPTNLDNAQNERRTDYADRVELYFAQDAALTKPYFAAEMDRQGRVMDYCVSPGRKFDYAFAFKTLKVSVTAFPHGYAVAGTVDVAELRALGVDVAQLHMGIHRADYAQDGTLQGWYSARPFGAGEPNFHQSSMFFKVNPMSCNARRMPGKWCSLGTSITWYNNHVDNSRGRFTRGYQDRVKDVLKFDSFANRGVNGGVVASQFGQIEPADWYTIEHGINDWGQGVKPGTFADYTSNASNRTFAANYRILIDRLRNVSPCAKIILCTPRKGYGFGTYLPKSSADAKNGVYLEEYAKLVRTIAQHEGFAVADFYANCGEDQELKALSIDVALHPNDAGYQRMADELVYAFSQAQ